jgi:hypothetical protein
VLDLKNHPGAEKGDTQLLRVCLYYLTFSEGSIEWVDKKTRAGNDISESAQLEVDFLFDEDPTQDANQKEYKRLTEASLISLLRLTGVEEEPVEKPIRQTDQEASDLLSEPTISCTCSQGTFHIGRSPFGTLHLIPLRMDSIYCVVNYQVLVTS